MEHGARLVNDDWKGWGARMMSDGTVRFRLWAPDAQSIGLFAKGRDYPMELGDDGWHQADLAGFNIGDTYQFRLPDGSLVCDPASRAQADDISGPSMIVDHATYAWQHDSFKGRPWAEAIILELHIGTFTPEGTFRAAIEKLPRLREAGMTAIEIMPVAQFHGARGWGYDGVLQYAPHSPYGPPDDLKALIDAAHGLGMMVMLDVVYNHFGPEGNHLERYASGFFRPGEPTPWGRRFQFENRVVRQYFLDNAAMWIGDYRIDGLRFDATEQIRDESEEHFLEEITRDLRQRFPDRHLHLVAEDQYCRRSMLDRAEHNQPKVFTAIWNDSLHHALHVLTTGEAKGHYARYGQGLWEKIRHATACGFITSEEPHRPVAPDAYINFLQNHDQIGNRAFGTRLVSMLDEGLYQTLTAMMILTPQTPMLFMGEEYGETNPFCFFADFGGELGQWMRENRVAEAENFGGMPEGKTLADLPDPMQPSTFAMSKLDWSHAQTEEGRRKTQFVRMLADLRQLHVAPLLSKGAALDGVVHDLPEGLLAVDWEFPNATLSLRLNLTNAPARMPDVTGAIIHATGHDGGIDGRTIEALPGPGIAVSVNRKGIAQ